MAAYKYPTRLQARLQAAKRRTDKMLAYHFAPLLRGYNSPLITVTFNKGKPMPLTVEEWRYGRS